MEITLSTGQTAFALDDVRAALQAALSREAIWHAPGATLTSALARSSRRNSRSRLTSFSRDFEAGTLGDDLEYFDWYAAKRGLISWDRRTEILSGVARVNVRSPDQSGEVYYSVKLILA